MTLDLSTVTDAFSADVIVLAVLGVAGVLVTVVVAIVAVMQVMAMVRGEPWRWSESSWRQMGFDSLDDYQHFSDAKRHGYVREYYKDKQSRRERAGR